MTATGLKGQNKCQHKSKGSHLINFQVALLCFFFFFVQIISQNLETDADTTDAIKHWDIT